MHDGSLSRTIIRDSQGSPGVVAVSDLAVLADHRTSVTRYAGITVPGSREL
jgi:hypothetical protein